MRRLPNPFDLVSNGAFFRSWLQTFCVLLIPVSILQAEPLETQSNPVGNGAIQVVNGNPNRSNWSKIPAYQEDGIDGATPNNYFAVQVANDANQIFFRFLMEESDEFGFRHNVYLDADQDRTTGFIGTGAGFLSLGAEYLIQGGSIFRFNGGQQTSWGWDWIEDISWDATNHKDIALAVRRQALKNSPAFDFLMNAANFDLGTEEDFYPDMSSQPAGDYFTYQFGTIAAVTIDELSAAIRAGSTEKRYDLNNDRKVDLLDHRYWVEVLNKTYFGDANLDGRFDSSDFVRVFQAGQYEDSIAINSLWATGDWNGDGEFTSSDFVAAFQGGGFEQGPRPAVKSVPEPSGSLWLLGVLALAVRGRRTLE